MLNTSTIRGTFRQIPYWKLRGRFHSCGFRDQEIANAIGIGTDTIAIHSNSPEEPSGSPGLILIGVFRRFTTYIDVIGKF